MKYNAPRGAAQRYVSRMGIAQRQGDLEFLMATARSFDQVVVWRKSPAAPVIPTPSRPMTIFEIAMKALEVNRGR